MTISTSNPFENIEGITKRTMVLFFLIDTSGSMAGKKIGEVNYAISEVLPEIRRLSDDNADAEIKIAVLTFSTGAEWVYNNPISVQDFEWTHIDANGVTDLGNAYEMLNEKLSRKAFMGDVTGSYAPAIFLMSDGEPTSDYANALEKLKNNSWFKASIKVALAIGDATDMDVLQEFTGNSETVLKAHTPEQLRSMIRFVSVTASKIGSQSSNSSASGQTKQEIFAEQIKDRTTNEDWATMPIASDDWD
jgi:uncharacterized protein YegL